MIVFEWRACVRDSGDLECDYEGPFDTREEAEMILPLLMDAEPVYDEGWIERRPRVSWERVEVAATDSPQPVAASRTVARQCQPETTD